SSWFAKQAEETGAVIPIEVASGLPGALLVRKPAAGATGHVVVCTGDGGTIEAKGSKYGVVAGRVDGRRWDLGIRIPSLHYSESARARPVAAPTASLSVGSSGGLVLQLQRALLERGYQPGLLDGEFGTRTAAALMAFQRAEGEVVDGEAGPETLAALGIQP
ncbi:MAG TPA: peptidoglycan-binding domain-containing protein, partial [Polyangiaceae bacterium]|nr:peptidoglycan-binding domain-containing protein [Polyangiaceae bacterium]